MPTLRERILEIARSLPPAPRVFAELDGLLRDANSGLEEIAALIKRDATLVGHVIRVSNSAAYGGDQPTGSVEEAVVRIGFQEVFRVVGQVASSRLAERAMVSYGIETDRLREHMLHTAFVCEHLATECGIDPRSAYTAGLMRPLGLLVLDRLAEQYGNISAYDPAQDADYLAWEGRSFGLSSCEVAGMVLREWAFPNVIVEAIQAQYLLRSEDLNQPFACLVNLAGSLVTEDGRGLPGEARHWGGSEWKLDTLSLSPSRFQAAAGRARDAYAAFQRRLRGDPDPEIQASGTRVQGSELQGDGGDLSEARNFESSSRVLQANDDPPVHNTPAAPEAPPTGASNPMVEPAVSPPADDFTTFMRKYQDMVYSTAARITGNDAQAEDIAQEVFIKAHENFDHLQTSPTAGGWLKTVATNLSLNHISRYRSRWRFFSEFRRKGDAGEADETPMEFAAPEEFFANLEASDRRALVESALAQLPEHQRVPLVLYHFEDMPYDEIAKKLRISLSKVKIDILRGRTALAKILTRSDAGRETLPSIQP